MPGETENNRRERFLRTYANLPLNARKEIILVLEEEGGKRQPLTWEVVYFEVKNNTQRTKEILEKLEGLELI